MRTRRNRRSTAGQSSFALAKSIGRITVVLSACSAALAGACGDAQPANPTGAGGMGASSSSGNGGEGLSDFTTSSNVSTANSSSGVASSSGGGPVCPKPEPNGGATKFAKAFGDSAVQTGAAVAFDKSGNVLLAGSFSGTVNLGGTTLTSAGQDDVFVAKFNSTGQLLWAKAYGDGDVQNAAGIGADAMGNVYVTGNFKGSMNFGGETLKATGTLFVDPFLVKLKPDGGHEWSQKYGDEFVQQARGLAVDSAGNVLLVGSFQQTVNFGGALLTAVGGQDAFIAKYGPTGAHQWSRRYGDAMDQYARAVTLDEKGNVYVAGDAAGSIDFGTGAMTAMGTPSAFVAKLDPLGNAAWVQLSGGMATSVARANAIAVGANGAVAVAGFFKGVFDLGSGMPLENGAVDDAFVTLLDGMGKHQFTKAFGDNTSQSGTAVVVTTEGDVILAGNFTGSVDLGAGQVMSGGAFDGFVGRFDPTGCLVWGRIFAGAGSLSTQGMALDPITGGVAVTGSFNGATDFGMGTLTASMDDVFLVSVNP